MTSHDQFLQKIANGGEITVNLSWGMVVIVTLNGGIVIVVAWFKVEQGYFSNQNDKIYE